MKPTKAIFLSLVLTGTVALAHTASAQFKPTGDDGITASPRARQLLDEQKNRTTAAASGTTANTGAFANGIAASPRVHQMMNERRALTSAPAASTELASVGYRATGPDGITASPKVREQLNERSTVFMVAPVK